MLLKEQAMYEILEPMFQKSQAGGREKLNCRTG
jgi:hypothetical protein